MDIYETAPAVKFILLPFFCVAFYSSFLLPTTTSRLAEAEAEAEAESESETGVEEERVKEKADRKYQEDR